MSRDIATTALKKMYLVKLGYPEFILRAQFNPTQLPERVSANYQKLAPVGLSHKIHQYVGTENHSMTIDLFFHSNHYETMPDPVFENLDPTSLPSTSSIDLGNRELEEIEGLGTAVGDIVIDDDFDKTRLQRIAAARNVLLSLVYPEAASTIVQAAPPKVLFVWPNIFSMVCRVMSVDIRHERFTQDGATRQFRATVVFEESREERLVHNDVLSDGTIRAEASVLNDTLADLGLF
jgi:hypothetical protein